MPVMFFKAEIYQNVPVRATALSLCTHNSAPSFCKSNTEQFGSANHIFHRFTRGIILISFEPTNAVETFQALLLFLSSRSQCKSQTEHHASDSPPLEEIHLCR